VFLPPARPVGPTCWGENPEGGRGVLLQAEAAGYQRPASSDQWPAGGDRQGCLPPGFAGPRPTSLRSWGRRRSVSPPSEARRADVLGGVPRRGEGGLVRKETAGSNAVLSRLRRLSLNVAVLLGEETRRSLREPKSQNREPSELGTIVAMRPVLTPAASARLDAASTDPGPVLMERAGLGVALAAVDMGARYGTRVTVLAGPGNNGGDGYVAARHLWERGVAVRVYALAEPRTDDARWAHEKAIDAGVPIYPFGPVVESDLIIDALFGSGFRGILPDEVVPWIGTSAPVLSVDIPSGLDGTTGLAEGPVFRAATTVTFHSPKVGQVIGVGPDVCGQLRTRDIGLRGGDAEFFLAEAADAPRPVRSRTAHKWSAGSVLVVGGSPGMTGAPLLAARSALHGGAGAVSIATPGGLQSVYSAAAPELLNVAIGNGVRFEAEDAHALANAARRFDVLALGPGLGPGRDEFVAAVLASWAGKLLIDADGLNALQSPDALAARSAPTVITPHAGEFRRLTGTDADHIQAADLATRAGVVVLLKGSPTFVMGTTRWAVDAGGRELATIGSGDVLTGLLAALWARGLDAETAARSAAYWHGRAGRSLADRQTVTADELAVEVGTVAW
jgi:ADP-dependent NAD(P)H-hydrate dehydratase / NAD(P)H-hydrate epimerase